MVAAACKTTSASTHAAYRRPSSLLRNRKNYAFWTVSPTWIFIMAREPSKPLLRSLNSSINIFKT